MFPGPVSLRHLNYFFMSFKSFLLTFLVVLAGSPVAMAQENLALGGSATATSGGNSANAAIDGNAGTRFESAHGIDAVEWILDMGRAKAFNTIQICWEGAYSKSFTLAVSNDGVDYATIYTETDKTLAGFPVDVAYNVGDQNARYIKFTNIARGTQYGVSFWEFRVFNIEQQLKSLTLSADKDAVRKGDAVNLSVAGKDQVGADIDVSGITYEITPPDAGTLNGNVFTPAKAGNISIVAKKDELKSNSVDIYSYAGTKIDIASICRYRVQPLNDLTLMAGKENAFDEDMGSQWALINYETGDWRDYTVGFTVDFTALYDVSALSLTFEGACPADYQVIAIDNDGNETEIFSKTGQPGMATVTQFIPAFCPSTRYIKFISTKAATQYGIKFFDFSVYGDNRREVADTKAPVFTLEMDESSVTYEGVTITLSGYDDKSDVISYEITYTAASGEVKTDIVKGEINNTITYEVYDLRPDTEQTVTVVARDMDGNASEPQVVNFRTKPGISLDFGVEGASLIWANMESNRGLQPYVARAFDGDNNTVTDFNGLAGLQWVGASFDSPKVIARISYVVPEGVAKSEYNLGVFQGANDPSFIDAVPLYMLNELDMDFTPGRWQSVDIPCNQAFKYVRYAGPGSKDDCNVTTCRIAGLRFEAASDEVAARASNDVAYYRPTSLPLVIVNTVGDTFFDESQPNKSERNTLEGSRVIIIDENGEVNVDDAKTQIRGRGNSSWNLFHKKPFRMKFNKSTKVLGSTAKGKKWTMINNQSDKTLIRNNVAFEMGRRLGMEFVPQASMVDLIFNGQYMGTYQLSDQIDVRPGRVDVTEIDREDTAAPTDGGFLVEVDAYAYQEPAGEWMVATAEDAAGKKYDFPLTIKSPDPVTENVADDVVFSNLKSSFEQMMKSVYDFGLGVDTDYRERLDVDSFLRYLIAEEYAGNPDAFWSIYMYKDTGSDMWHVGPMWDLDLAFYNDMRLEFTEMMYHPFDADGNFTNVYKGMYAGDMPLNQWWDSPERQYPNGDGAVQRFIRILLEDPANKERLTELWSLAHKYDGLDAQSLTDYIDEQSEKIDLSQQLNFQRWPVLADVIHQNPTPQYATYAEHVDRMKYYVTNKADLINKTYGLNLSVTGIEDVDLPSVDGSPVLYFNIQGQRIANPAPGQLVIRRQGSKAAKIVF